VRSRRTRAAPRTRRRRAHELLAAADTICCSTTASEPLFDGHVVADHTTVVAIGSHEPDARDVHDALVGRDGGRRVELLGAARGACVTAPRRHRSLAVSRERQPAMHLSRNGLPLPRERSTEPGDGQAAALDDKR
jgi:ornithine cyclodeaminase/alanine dehydrogenase-like protein (mu-crystallin family)